MAGRVQLVGLVLTLLGEGLAQNTCPANTIISWNNDAAPQQAYASMTFGSTYQACCTTPLDQTCADVDCAAATAPEGMVKKASPPTGTGKGISDCCVFTCASLGTPPGTCPASVGTTAYKNKATQPTTEYANTGAALAGCCETDTTKCGGIAALACDAGKMWGNYETDISGAADDAAKKTACCVDKTCASTAAVACDAGQAWESNTAVAGTTDTTKKAACCKDVVACSAVTCPDGWKAKSGSPTCTLTSATACLGSCCELDTTKCGGNVVSCPRGKIQGNPTADAGTTTSAKEAACCVDAERCSATFTTTTAAPSSNSTNASSDPPTSGSVGAGLPAAVLVAGIMIQLQQ